MRGKQLPTGCPWKTGKEHPRACGENGGGGVGVVAVRGTSPRMRGKRGYGVGEGSAAGEHPRACGENAPITINSFSSLGTSPRMRGKLGQIVLELPNFRNIPAHAGKTCLSSGVWSRHGEHPRACGENCSSSAKPVGVPGTSPRMRGKLFLTQLLNHPIRNIPAHAGKTPRHGAENPEGREHPRACGENGQLIEGEYQVTGTSPRMRGKRQGCSGRATRRGNIPAHAGKTPLPAGTRTQLPEHPRACGENYTSALLRMYNVGTSPRMRGKR